VATTLQLYSNAFVTLDGRLLTEEASISVDKKSGLNPVFTVPKGFAGMSQGAASCEVTIETAVPAIDFEFNPDAYMRTAQVVEVGIVLANRQTVFKGFITDASYSHSANQESKLQIKIMTQFADFE
jgi:hypothetical protein